MRWWIMQVLKDVMFFCRDWWPIITFFIGGVGFGFKGVKTLNSTLLDIRGELKTSNQRIEEIASDTIKIWVELKDHENKIEELGTTVTRHDEKIKTLFNQKG